jgi:parvulin-like peptidyl-prolyl isomerase
MNVVHVANLSIEAAEIINFLKQDVRLKEICHDILCQQIIQHAAQERQIEVTAAEIQAEADQQRRLLHLESAAATLTWLRDQLIAPENWEVGIHRRLLKQKLAQTLFEPETAKYFAEHRLDFEQVSLYKLTVPYQQLSQELLYQIEENEISFYEAAHLYDVDQRCRLQCGYQGCFYRWHLKPELAALIFGAQPGAVLGPQPGERGFDLWMVENFITADLTPEIRNQITEQLFQEWLNSELNHLLHNSNQLDP